MGTQLTQAAVTLEIGALNLTGDVHYRGRFKKSTGQAGDGIGSTGTGGHQTGTKLAASARITFCGNSCALLVEHAYSAQARLT
ncbi:hypothetical protein D3C77_553860 [compost metagenome]